MAETATPKKVQLQEVDLDFDVNAKYTYVLAFKNEARGRVFDENGNKRGDAEYPTRRNVLLRSSIVWPKNTIDPFNPDKPRSAGRHLIRYYDGCTTLFVDDQPKEKEAIDQLIASTRQLYFVMGYLNIQGYDKMLKLFMDWASWNEGSPYRVMTIDPIFKMLDPEKSREEEAANIDDVEKALKLAGAADEKKMFIHAKFLDVPTIDEVTGNTLSPKALRAEYRKAAMNNTKRFLATYNDESMQFKYWIEKGITEGELSTTKIPNRASWARKGVVICDISGFTSYEAILNKLIEEAKTNEEFATQLKALYN